jgi:hypothetical protein
MRFNEKMRTNRIYPRHLKRESMEAMSNLMKKQITYGLIASALALSTAAFAPTEAQATEQERRLNQMAMQMYMNNQSIAAQQQYWNNSTPYYNNTFNNSYLNSNAYGNPYYGNRNIYGNGYYNSNRFNDRYYNNYDNRLRFNSSTVGRILNRVF